MFCKGLPLVRYLFAILLTRACTLRQLSKAGQRQLGLIRSRHMMHRQSHALDYRVILLILWLLGFSFHVGGALIHIILVIVVIVVVIRLVTGRGV
jgi:Family of unknown function (DUF5670)